MTQYSQLVLAKASKIKCLISDVDGVLTDGAIIYDNNGLEYKRFSVKDGQIIKYLKESGILVGVITGRDSEVVRFRCNELNFDFHYHGVKDKDAILLNVLQEHGLQHEEVAFIGDDLNDLPILTQIGLSATPNDGHYKVKERVDVCTSAKGGEGVLREVADLILESKGEYKQIIERLIR